MATHDAWALVCRFFAGGTPVFRNAMSARDVAACATLGPAVKPTTIDQRFALCPYCQLRNGQVWADGRGGRVCHCPDCGPIPVDADDLAALALDEQWLRTKLRMSLEINSRDGVDELSRDVWRLGEARRGPVLLARSLMLLWCEPTLFDRVRVAGANIRVIAPRPAQTRGAPFGPGVDWLPLEERFTFYGGGITYIPEGESPGTAPAAEPRPPTYGPFSEDFRRVDLVDWPHGSIRCTEGQAAVFRALWSFAGEPMPRERIMQRANLDSEKPADLFKVKPRDKDRPEAEGPLFAYRSLVRTQQRAGLYSMPCAADKRQ